MTLTKAPLLIGQNETYVYLLRRGQRPSSGGLGAHQDEASALRLRMLPMLGNETEAEEAAEPLLLLARWLCPRPAQVMRSLCLRRSVPGIQLFPCGFLLRGGLPELLPRRTPPGVHVTQAVRALMTLLTN